jgi:tetratricopeptide (TPR) repeat protein
MSSLRAFKQKPSAVSRLWQETDYDAALAQVEELRKAWPGNGHLHILWASLVQLQEHPRHGLDEAKQALQQAIELDRSSPAGAIELGHFLDAVEGNPQAAAKAYSEGVLAARQLLLDGLIGQAKALLQLGKSADALRCVLEVVHLLPFEPGPRRSKSQARDTLRPLPLNGLAVDHIEELLSEIFASRSA